MEYHQVGRNYPCGRGSAVFPVGGFCAGSAFSVPEKAEKPPGKVSGYGRHADHPKAGPGPYLCTAGYVGQTAPHQTSGVRYAEKQAIARIGWSYEDVFDWRKRCGAAAGQIFDQSGTASAAAAFYKHIRLKRIKRNKSAVRSPPAAGGGCAGALYQ